MARGFWLGVMQGGALGVAGLAALSLALPGGPGDEAPGAEGGPIIAAPGGPGRVGSSDADDMRGVWVLYPPTDGTLDDAAGDQPGGMDGAAAISGADGAVGGDDQAGGDGAAPMAADQGDAQGAAAAISGADGAARPGTDAPAGPAEGAGMPAPRLRRRWPCRPGRNLPVARIARPPRRCRWMPPIWRGARRWRRWPPRRNLRP